MNYVQDILASHGAETTDQQIEKACADLCTAMKDRRNHRRTMAELKTVEEKARLKLNEAIDALRDTKLGFTI